MDPNANALNWFEIPAHDIERAQHFYEGIFDMKMERMDMGGQIMAGFPTNQGSGKVGGAVVKSPFHVPSMDGGVIYLNGNPDLAAVLDRVHAHGGNIVMPKTEIGGDVGFMAMFSDTEGNRVALHSNK
jgi:hypothetical protein